MSPLPRELLMDIVETRDIADGGLPSLLLPIVIFFGKGTELSRNNSSSIFFLFSDTFIVKLTSYI